MAALNRLGALAPAALTSALFVRGLNPHLPGWSCPLRLVTGIPCPTCFLTRATAAALTGNLSESVRLHAFGPAVAAGLVVWSVLAIRQRRLLPLARPGVGGLASPARLSQAGAVALVAYWALRLGLHIGLGWSTFPAG